MRLPWQVEPGGDIHLPPSQHLSSTKLTATRNTVTNQGEQSLGQILQEIEREENYEDMMAAAEAPMVNQPHVSRPRFCPRIPQPTPRKITSMKMLDQDPQEQNLDNTSNNLMDTEPPRERPARKSSPPVWWETDGDTIKMTAPPAWLAEEQDRT